MREVSLDKMGGFGLAVVLLLLWAANVCGEERYTVVNNTVTQRYVVVDNTKTPVPPSSPGQIWYTRPPVGHTHTCENGHTWDHKANPDHVCIAPRCGLSQYIQDPTPRPVHIIPTSGSVGQQTYQPQFQLPQSSSGCPGGNCSVPQRSSSGWYLGKRLGR